MLKYMLVLLDLPNLEENFTVSVWADVLKPTTAQVVARYSQDYYAGKAAATINTFGDGQVIYIGTMGDDSFNSSIAKWVLELGNIEPLLLTPAGIEVTQRWQADQRLLFVLNHNAIAEEISLDNTYTDLITGKTFSGTITIEPREVLILV